MTQDRITQADLDWWLARAAELEWIFAKTYAETAPHSYVVEGRTSGMSQGLMAAPKFVQRAARLPEVLALLSAYPEGLPLRVLAEALRHRRGDPAPGPHDVPQPRVLGLGLQRLPPVGSRVRATGSWRHRRQRRLHHCPSGERQLDRPRGRAPQCRRPGRHLHSRHCTPRCGPDDTDLAEALGVIAKTMYGESASQPRVGDWNTFLRLCRRPRNSSAGSRSSTRGRGARA